MTRRFCRDALGEGVVDVGEVDDAALERGLVFAEAVGVAGAVPVFVVAAGDFAGGGEVRAVGEDALAGDGVLLHDGAFFVGKRAGLFEDVVGNVELSDVVKDGGAGDPADVLIIVAQHAGERFGQRVHPAEVAAGVLVLHFAGDGEDVNRVVVGVFQFVGAGFKFGGALADTLLERLVLVLECPGLIEHGVGRSVIVWYMF